MQYLRFAKDYKPDFNPKRKSLDVTTTPVEKHMLAQELDYAHTVVRIVYYYCYISLEL